MAEFRGVYNHTGVLRRVMLCKPLYYRYIPLNAAAMETISKGVTVNKEKLMHQHALLERAFRDNGVDILWVDPDPQKPFQNGTRDWGVMTKEGALIGNFLHSERKGEEINVMKCLQRENIPILGRIQKGTLEGGDCIYLDEKTLAIGCGARTSPEGIAEAARILKKIGVEVVPVEIYARWLHLDGVFSVLDEKLAAVCREAIPPYFMGFLKGKGFEVIEVPAEQVVGRFTLNLVNLGDHRIISTKDNPLTETLERRGFKVIEIDFDEFMKGGSGPHCNCHDVDRDK